MNNEQCRAPEVVASSKSQREVSIAVVAEAGVVSPGGEYLQCDRLTRPMHAKWRVGGKRRRTWAKDGGQEDVREIRDK